MRRWLHKFSPWTKTIWPALIWSAFIFVLLMIPSDKLPGEKLIIIPFFDKIVHLILFGAFALLWDIYLVEYNIFIQKKYRYTLILLGIVLYGWLLEYLQIFAGRQFDYIDILADMGGVLALKTRTKSPG